MPRALVTGSTGFLGRHLADALAGAGYEVRTLDVIPPGPSRAGTHEFVEVDVRDADALRKAARGCDVVVDNAALVPISRSSLAQFREVNVRGCENTIDAAEAAGAYLVHISSSAIYGIPKRLPATLDTPVAPVESYGQSKAEAEEVVEGRRREDYPIVSLRPRALLGPGRLGVFDLLFARIRAGKRVPLLGAGNTVQLCHVDDFCSAMLAAIDRRSNGTYNIAAEKFSPTIREDFEAMIERVGTHAKVQSVPVLAARALLPPLAAVGLVPFTAWHWRGAPASFWCDVSDAKRDLGWRPRYSNVDALVAAYTHYVSRSAAEAEGSLHTRPLGGLLARLLSR